LHLECDDILASSLCAFSNASTCTAYGVACILLGTAAHLTDTDAAVGCLAGAAAALAPGGIVVLELEHPYDLFEGTLMNAEGDAWDREVEGVKVLVEWGREGDFFDGRGCLHLLTIVHLL
jgi:hypothetical protein